VRHERDSNPRTKVLQTLPLTTLVSCHSVFLKFSVLRNYTGRLDKFRGGVLICLLGCGNMINNMPTHFAGKVYSALRKVPKGKVTTYKKLAESINSKAYRAVGHALSQNPYAPAVPCHRVVASDGTIGGFMGQKTGEAIRKKIKLLESEGIVVENGKIVDFEKKVVEIKN
jgi:methylated-DNA-[protein]-cysteine S-methyltransferase